MHVPAYQVARYLLIILLEDRMECITEDRKFVKEKKSVHQAYQAYCIGGGLTLVSG